MINRVSWVGTMTRTNTLAHTRLVTACDSHAGLDNSTRERGRRKSVRERERERERCFFDKKAIAALPSLLSIKTNAEAGGRR